MGAVTMPPSPSVEFVIPVLNEERALPVCVERLHGFLSDAMRAYDWRIVVADNGSTDRTPAVCEELSGKYEEVGYLRLEERGRGRALRTAWLASDADYLCYMDVDLSTELEAIPPLIDSLAKEGYDLAVGSRLKKGATVIGQVAQARGGLAMLQPHHTVDVLREVPRRAVRLQGCQSKGGA